MVTLGMDRRPTPGPSTHAIGSWKLILTSAQSIMSILTYSSLDAATKNNYLSIRDHRQAHSLTFSGNMPDHW